MSTIKLKRSAVQGKVPTTTDLDLGELAINTFDGKLYLKKDDGTQSIVDVTATSSGGGAAVTVSATAPGAPSEGDLWWDEDLGTMFIYYNDGDSAQWVQSSPQSGTSGSGIALTDLSVGTEGVPSGDGSITYNNSTGVFTYTPPDLSGFAESANLATVATSGSYGDLLNTPNIPSDVSDLTDGTGLLFDGNYSSLTGAPTSLSSFTNDPGYITGYTVTEADVTQYQANLSITESQITDLGSYISSADISIAPEPAPAGDGSLVFTSANNTFTYTPPDLSPFLTSIPAEYLTQTEGDARYIQTETNDLTASVTWANVPDANITETSVTQHQAALSITESQISDLQNYLTTVALNNVSDVSITSPTSGQVLKYNGANWVNDTDSTGTGGGITTGKAIAMAIVFG